MLGQGCLTDVDEMINESTHTDTQREAGTERGHREGQTGEYTPSQKDKQKYRRQTDKRPPHNLAQAGSQARTHFLQNLSPLRQVEFIKKTEHQAVQNTIIYSPLSDRGRHKTLGGLALRRGDTV